MGLRFDALAPIRPDQVAPLESYATRDGGTLPVRYYESHAEVASTLLLLHGSGYHSRYLAPLAARLAAAGIAHVHTPDLRGHGESPVRRGDIDYIDQLEDDVADLIANASARHPNTRILLGGHSSGGGLALRFAGSRHAQQAQGFLLLAPYLGHDAPTTRRDAGWARPSVPVIAGLSILNGFGIRALNGLSAIRFDMPQSARDGTETLSYSFRLQSGFAPRDYRKDLAAVKVPLLALMGELDEAFYANKFEATLMEFSQAHVEIVAGAAHLDLPALPETADHISVWLSEFAS